MNEQALRRALEVGESHLLEEQLAPAREALRRLDERARLEPDRTVVAMIGATGSGKSSLTNAIVGTEVARVAATRPTTSKAKAIVFGGGGGALLDWLEIAERVDIPGPEGLILLDLPDVDSVVSAHKQITHRLANAVDVLMWVLDPEKYADAVMHQEFIEPFAEHGEVAFAVVNQADRLSESDREAIADDVKSLVSGYGLPAEVMLTSARTGDGVAELRERLLAIAAARTSRAARAHADVTRAARLLADQTVGGAEGAGGVGGPSGASGVGGRRGASAASGTVGTIGTVADPTPVVAAAAKAAGVALAERAVRVSTIRSGRASVGWPVTRWLAKFRPDPLKRLHLDRDVPSELVRTSLPEPSPVQLSAVRSEAQRLVDGAVSELPNSWRSSVIHAMDSRVEETLESLDGAVASTNLGVRSPHWWTAVSWLQWLLLTAAVVGAGWLGGLMLLDYLVLPKPDLPMAGPIPWPTALLLGGLALGFFMGIVCMVFVRWRAGRVSRRAGARLRAAVESRVEERFVAPLKAEMAQWEAFRAALTEAQAG